MEIADGIPQYAHPIHVITWPVIDRLRPPVVGEKETRISLKRVARSQAP